MLEPNRVIIRKPNRGHVRRNIYLTPSQFELLQSVNGRFMSERLITIVSRVKDYLAKNPKPEIADHKPAKPEKLSLGVTLPPHLVDYACVIGYNREFASGVRVCIEIYKQFML